MFDLDGKSALVTGASGGIGGAIARALHGQGAVVALSGRNQEALAGLAAELGDKAHVLPGDLAQPEAAAGLVERAEAAMERIDILVNNAGFTRDGLFMRMADEDWQTVIDVNLSAPFRLARAVLRPMMRARWGRIINITSVVGATGNPGQANYVASKAGLTGMTKALAAEVASRGITVNCVAPGFITTRLTEKLNDEQKEALLARIPGRRFGTPRDVAACVVFLASEDASYITGQSLHVNGGMAMI
jgi:3-oxoacyl-[acyl-carrier protein] reductase